MSRICDFCDHSGSYDDCWAQGDCINGSLFKPIESPTIAKNKHNADTTYKTTSDFIYCPYCGKKLH